VKLNPDTFSNLQLLKTAALSADRAFAFTDSDDIYGLFELPAIKDVMRIIGYLPENATCQLYRVKQGDEFSTFMCLSINCSWKKPSYDPFSVVNIKANANKAMTEFVAPFEKASKQISDYTRKLKVSSSNILKSKSENRLFNHFEPSFESANGLSLSSTASGSLAFFKLNQKYGAIIEVTGFTDLLGIPNQEDGTIFVTTIRSVGGLEAKEVNENAKGTKAFRAHLKGETPDIEIANSVLAWNHSIILTSYNSRTIQSLSVNAIQHYLTHNVSVIQPRTLLKQTISSLMPGQGRHHPYPIYLDTKTAIATTSAFLEER
jgi:hypothetical protein